MPPAWPLLFIYRLHFISTCGSRIICMSQGHPHCRALISHCPLFPPYLISKTLPLPSVTPSPSITAAMVGYPPALCPPVVLFASHSKAFNTCNLYTCGNLGSQADIPIKENTLSVGTDLIHFPSLLTILFAVTLPPDLETKHNEVTLISSSAQLERGRDSEYH